MAALDFPASPTVGQTYTANGLAYTFNGVSWALASPGSAPPSFVGCRVYNSTTQSIPSAADTVITFDTESFDTSNIHSTASNTGRFTAPVAGYYRAVCGTNWQANVNNGGRTLYWRKNGSVFLQGSENCVYTGNASTLLAMQCVLPSVYLLAGDYLECIAYENIGGAALTIGHATNVDQQTGASFEKIDGVVGPAGSGSQQHCVRLYSASGTPVPVSDTATVSTLYVGPFEGNQLTVLGSADVSATYTLSEISLALSGLTSGKPYDVFVYYSGSAFVIELSAAWTNDTTRADALALVNGLYVKSSDHTRLHVGTIYTTGATSTTDTAANRYVWNRFNQRLGYMRNVDETTDFWNYTIATIRQARANTANQLNYVTGDAGTSVEAQIIAYAENGSAGIRVAVGVGVNSTTTFSSLGNGGQVNVSTGTSPLSANYKGRPGLGRNYLCWNEWSIASGTTQWYGDFQAGYNLQSGIAGTLWN